MGLLSVERRSSTGGRRSNRYRLHVGAVVSVDGEDSLESRQEDNLSGCGDPAAEPPVDNSGAEPVSVGVPARGQSVRLRKRTICPVAQPDTGVLSQPDTDVRLLPIWEPPLEPPNQTGPAEREGAGARDDVDDGLVGSGPAEPQAPGRSSHVSGGAAAGASRPVGSGRESADVSGRAPGTERLGWLLRECLPEHLRALDAEGARAVGALLDERLAAGWSPAQIRSAMDQGLPPRVGRLSALVASRLRRNVDPALAPSAGSVERVSDDVRWERTRRRSEELAGGRRRRPSEDEDAMGRALAQVRHEVPDVGRAEQARLAAELVRSWGAGGPAGDVGDMAGEPRGVAS